MAKGKSRKRRGKVGNKGETAQVRGGKWQLKAKKKGQLEKPDGAGCLGFPLLKEKIGIPL